MSTLARSLTPVLAAMLLSIVAVAPVLAHAELKTSDPEDKAVLATPPTVITLTFTEGLDQAKSSFALNGPAGTVGTGKPVKQGGKVMTLEGLVLASGAYSIKWTSASTDGHLDRGTLSFTVLEPTPTPATAAPATAVASGGPPSPAPSSAATAPSTAATAPSTAATATDGASVAPQVSPAASAVGADPGAVSSSGSDVVVPIIAGLVLIAGLGAFILRRSRKA